MKKFSYFSLKSPLALLALLCLSHAAWATDPSQNIISVENEDVENVSGGGLDSATAKQAASIITGASDASRELSARFRNITPNADQAFLGFAIETATNQDNALVAIDELTEIYQAQEGTTQAGSTYLAMMRDTIQQLRDRDYITFHTAYFRLDTQEAERHLMALNMALLNIAAHNNIGLLFGEDLLTRFNTDFDANIRLADTHPDQLNQLVEAYEALQSILERHQEAISALSEIGLRAGRATQGSIEQTIERINTSMREIADRLKIFQPVIDEEASIIKDGKHVAHMLMTASRDFAANPHVPAVNPMAAAGAVWNAFFAPRNGHGLPVGPGARLLRNGARLATLSAMIPFIAYVAWEKIKASYYYCENHPKHPKCRHADQAN